MKKYTEKNDLKSPVKGGRVGTVHGYYDLLRPWSLIISLPVLEATSSFPGDSALLSPGSTSYISVLTEDSTVTPSKLPAQPPDHQCLDSGNWASFLFVGPSAYFADYCTELSAFLKQLGLVIVNQPPGGDPSSALSLWSCYLRGSPT